MLSYGRMVKVSWGQRMLTWVVAWNGAPSCSWRFSVSWFFHAGTNVLERHTALSLHLYLLLWQNTFTDLVPHCNLSGVQRQGVSTSSRHSDGVPRFCSDCQSSDGERWAERFGYFSFPSTLLEMLCRWHFHSPSLRLGATVPKPPQWNRGMHPIHCWEGIGRWEATILGFLSMHHSWMYVYAERPMDQPPHQYTGNQLTSTSICPSTYTIQWCTRHHGEDIDEQSQCTIIGWCRMCGREEDCGCTEGEWKPSGPVQGRSDWYPPLSDHAVPPEKLAHSAPPQHIKPWERDPAQGVHGSARLV